MYFASFTSVTVYQDRIFRTGKQALVNKILIEEKLSSVSLTWFTPA
jgi:hypothetical protein